MKTELTKAEVENNLLKEALNTRVKQYNSEHARKSNQAELVAIQSGFISQKE
jgi:hypothetical protein